MKTGNIFKKILLPLAILAALILSSCSAGNAMNTKDSDYPEEPSASFNFEGYYGKSKSTDSAVSLSETDTQQTEQKLIKTCDIKAETKDFDSAIQAIEEKVTEFGGYIEQETLKNSSASQYNGRYGSGRTLTAVFRIPASNLQKFTDGISGSVSVTYLNSNVKEVSEEYYDIEAKLQTLKTERDSLLKMMSSLDTTKEYNFWYELHNRITEIEKEIASLEASIKNLDSRISYSAVALSLEEVIEFSVKEDPSFIERIGNAFKESWKRFAEGWADFAVWFVGAVPTLLVLAGITVVTIFIIKAIVRKNRRRKAARLAAQYASQMQSSGTSNNQ